MRGELGATELGKQIGRRTLVAYGLSSMVGAVFVFVFLTYVAPNETIDRSGSVVWDIGLFIGYFAVVALIGAKLGDRLAAQAICWVKEDRRPTDDERIRTFYLPLR